MYDATLSTAAAATLAMLFAARRSVRAARAAVIVQRGHVPTDKQLHACISHISSQGYIMASYCTSAEDAICAVTGGHADLVVVAYGGERVARGLAAHGARVEAVHPTPHIVEPPPPPESRPRPVEWIVRWFRGGRSVSEIAELLDSPTGDIRAELQRAGVRAPRRRK